MNKANKKAPRTEFRYNRKRKHYSYIYGFKGDYRQNLLLSSKPIRKSKKHGKTKIYKNVELIKHPNPNKPTEKSYLMNKRYLDHKDDFDYLLYSWRFDSQDRLKVKKVKKGKWR